MIVVVAVSLFFFFCAILVYPDAVVFAVDTVVVAAVVAS